MESNYWIKFKSSIIIQERKREFRRENTFFLIREWRASLSSLLVLTLASTKRDWGGGDGFSLGAAEIRSCLEGAIIELCRNESESEEVADILSLSLSSAFSVSSKFEATPYPSMGFPCSIFNTLSPVTSFIFSHCNHPC